MTDNEVNQHFGKSQAPTDVKSSTKEITTSTVASGLKPINLFADLFALSLVVDGRKMSKASNFKLLAFDGLRQSSKMDY